jgi:hypothetical protein
MGQFRADLNLRTVLPPKPGRWLWSTLRIYLLVLGTVIAGFFFLAGWLAAPGQRTGQLVFPLGALVILIVGIVLDRWWRGRHQNLDKKHHLPGSHGRL